MRRLFLFLIFASSLAMAGSWEDFVGSLRLPQGGHARLALCMDPSLLEGLIHDPIFQRLAAEDLILSLLGRAQAQDLLASQSARWVLVAPGGALTASGLEGLSGSRLLEAIHAAGRKTRWELREAFLREHPDQGEARTEEALETLREYTLHADDGKSGPGAAQVEAAVRAAESLARLAQVPGWPRHSAALAALLPQADLGAVPGARAPLGQLVPLLETRAAADPEDAEPARLWAAALDGARMPPEALAGQVAPVPGAVWPEAALVAGLAEPFRRRGEWAGLLKLLEALRPPAPPEPLSASGWDQYCGLQATLQAWRAVAQAGLGAWGEAQLAADEGLRWGGSPAAQASLLRPLGRPTDRPVMRQLFDHLARSQPSRPPMPAVPPPLRLTLLGRPAWLLAWTALREAPELALWSPGELRWEIAPPAAHAQARTRFGWDGRPRWALFQGEALLASGDTCLQGAALAAVLDGHGTPMLARLGQLLGARPDHLAARRARFQRLLQRMPDRNLESLLVEDARRAWVPLPFGPKEGWRPDPDLWAGAARSVLADLEEALRHWPSEPALWQAWIAWAPFHPGSPSLVALAQGLPFWSPEGDGRAVLPMAVHRAVAGELRRKGDYQLMRTWFQAAWDNLDHRPQAELRPWERTGMKELRAEAETAIVAPLREALRALGLQEQRVELEAAFAAMMGREPTRSR